MSLTAKQQDEHNRAVAAKAITEDPLVLEVLSTMQAHIFEVWRDEKLTPDQREELHRMQMTLNRFIGVFDGYLQGGAEARSILGLEPEEKTFMQRIKEFFNGTTT